MVGPRGRNKSRHQKRNANGHIGVRQKRNRYATRAAENTTLREARHYAATAACAAGAPSAHCNTATKVTGRRTRVVIIRTTGRALEGDRVVGAGRAGVSAGGASLVVRKKTKCVQRFRWSNSLPLKTKARFVIAWADTRLCPGDTPKPASTDDADALQPASSFIRRLRRCASSHLSAGDRCAFRVSHIAVAKRNEGNQIQTTSFRKTARPRIEKNESMPIGDTSIGWSGKK